MNTINKKLFECDAYKEMLPYERFINAGPESLTDAELLAIIIRTGSGTLTPIEIAHQILNLSGGKERGLNSLYTLTLDELKSVHGIGEVKAVKLKCLSELAKRMAYQGSFSGTFFESSRQIAGQYMEKMRHDDRERAVLLCLNNKHKLLNETVLSIGTVNSASVSPRDLFIHALKTGASSIVLLHNHPSGDPTPSRADVELTNKISESGNMLDVRLLDHIIIGNQSYYSFNEKGLLWQ
ncbi:MAG: DNA repair protein RadC [Butyrivibrio sp.]|uniref:RadC family protein n=1 Tax=Butyrivibrio sp. TaxID=28121 RepID=UPI001B1E34BA|nr:DNA repair protein RadC [Butyrivibrio sp.]MBO6239989.1 DNA repair protein RadC [Butyrivibrio sp.]